MRLFHYFTDQDALVAWLRPDEGLPARFEGVEEISAAGTSVYPGEGPQPRTINPPGIVVHAGEIGLLNSIDSQRQATVIRSRSRVRPPVQLDKV